MDLDAAALAATEILFELSGNRFPGLCEQTVEYNQGRSCWWYMPGWRWGGPLTWERSRIRLAGYPIQSVTEVSIAGVTIDPSEYRIERDRELVRLPDALGNEQWWPAPQSDFFITYQFGMQPPIIGIQAAAQLACEIAKACPGANGTVGGCELPRGMVRMTRQGFTVETQALGLWLIGSVRSGMPQVDAFLSVPSWRRPAPRVSLSVPEADPWPVRIP